MLTPDDLSPAVIAGDPLVPTYRKAEPPAIAVTASAEDALAAIVLSGQNGRIVSMETLEPDGDRSLMTITSR